MTVLDFPISPASSTQAFGVDAGRVRAKLLGALRHREDTFRAFEFADWVELVVAPAPRRRYTTEQLLAGSTDQAIAALYDATSWAQEGAPQGDELA